MVDKLTNSQDLEVLKYVREQGITPGEFPQSGIKYIEAPDGTKIIAEPTSLLNHDGKLLAGRLRQVNRKIQFADISNEEVTI